MINTKFLLTITSIAVAIIYYILLPVDQIVSIILGEYIAIGITLILIAIYYYFKIKLKGKLIYEFIPNTNYVSIKSTTIFFLIFQAVDFYSEDGFIGMVKLWFMYWVFGVLVYFLTHNINFYKNLKVYNTSKIS